MKRNIIVLLGLILLTCFSSSAWANLAAVGVPVGPHGYPRFYQDNAGLQLELCLDGDGVNGPCIYDPVTAGNAWSATAGFGAEAFYWMATANARPLVANGNALLVLGLEAAYNGDGSAVEGQQIVFGRVRVRFDVPAPGHYRITHPFGTIDLPEAFVAESIAGRKDVRLTTDIGGINPIDPVGAYAGALAAFGPTQVPFLTWPNFDDPVANPTLHVPVLDGLGNQIGVNRYVGDGATPHVVTGSPTGNNVFRIELQDPNTGEFNIVSETDLFVVMGKVLDPAAPFTAYTFPPPPPMNMFAVGPVNRAAAFPQIGSSDPHPGGFAAIPESPADPAAPVDYPAGTGFPIGFPYFYQERLSVEDPLNPGVFNDQGGLKLTICPASDPLCISAPPTNAAGSALNVGDESFYWSAVADISARTEQNRADVRLVMAMEGAFGNALGTAADGDQVVFGRVRIRADVDVPGDYTVTYPYGEITFTDVNTVDGINYTVDIGTFNIGGPGVDQGFIGALYGEINPFLIWDTFNPDPALNDPALVVANPADPLSPMMYVGNPLVRHAVIGSPTGNNFLRIQGPGGIDHTEPLFTVTGKLYDSATPVVQPPAGTPTVVNDAATTNQDQPVVIDVTANDLPGTSAITSIAIVVGLGPLDGTAVVNGTSITYTPAAGATGIDTFAYTATNAAGTSNVALVEVNVLPVTTTAVGRAELNLRRLNWNIRGTGAPGATVTLHAGPDLAGAVIGSALANGSGNWEFRSRVRTVPAVTSISVESSTGDQSLNQPLKVR